MCRLAPDGGAIADCYAGSGTVGVAAYRLGRPYYLGDLSRVTEMTFSGGWLRKPRRCLWTAFSLPLDAGR